MIEGFGEDLVVLEGHCATLKVIWADDVRGELTVLPGWACVPGRYRQPRLCTSPNAIKVLGGSLCNAIRGLWCGN